MLVFVSWLLYLLEGVVRAAIGNPEASTYRNSFSYMSILLIAIALGSLTIMIGLRAKQAQREQSSHMSRTDSNWIATRLFLVGWGTAVVGSYFAVMVLVRVVSYYARLNDPEIARSFVIRWCYECSGWESALGPEWNAVVGATLLATVAISIVMIITKGRMTQQPTSS
jgi:hypothetical protein